MKILKPGRDQKGWSTEATCTGNGNGGGGCGAVLLVEEHDVYRTQSQSIGDDSPTAYATFRCPTCSVLTDLQNFPGAMLQNRPRLRT